MAASSTTWTDRDSPPDLSSMSVNDTLTVTGKYASRQSLFALARQKYGAPFNNGKIFSVTCNSGPKSVVVTRLV